MSDLSDEFPGFGDLVRLDRTGTDRWCAAAAPLPGRWALGLLGARALVAAGHTVDTDWRWAHSVHLSQLAAPGMTAEAVYRVDRLRDDPHLSTRLVLVTHGEEPLATATVSFQVPRRGTGPSYQAADPPTLPDPHGLPDPHCLPDPHFLPDPRGLPGGGAAAPIQVRHLGPGRHRAWVRVTEELPDRILPHTAALLLATDLVVLPPDTAGYADLDTGRPLLPVVVDRTLRVHRSFRADDWVLYEHESPSASDYRSYATGRFFSSMGRLIASVSQETVLVPDPHTPAVVGSPVHAGIRARLKQTLKGA